MPLFRAFSPARSPRAATSLLLLAAACGDPMLPAEPTAPPAMASLAAASSSGVVISQVYGGGGNSGAPFTNDFVELHNAGTAPVAIDGWSIQYASATGAGALGANSGQLVALAGTIPAGKYLLIQLAGGATGAALPTPDITGSINMSASAGKVALVRQTAGLGCNGGSAPCSSTQLGLIEDLVGYGTANFFEGTGPAPGLSNSTAALRKGNGSQDTNNNAADFESGTPTPRNAGSAGSGGGGGPGGGDLASCALPFTPAYAIQGDGLTTPLSDQVVTTQGVVVGDYEGPSPALRGFYLQDAAGDGNPLTSDAVFVFNGNNDDVALGDVVRVTGTATEFQDQTQVASVTALVVCGTGASVAPVDVTLPMPTSTHFERYEGMLVRFPQTLTVTEHFQLGRFGQVVMSSGGRLAQPTNVALPGAAAAALQLANQRNRIIVDDALQSQNPDPILFGRGGLPLSASNTLRAGDQATGMVGVLTYTWAGNAASGNAYRLRPVGALGGGVPAFAATNPRPATPAAVGGTVRVATANLLNYFNTFTGCTNGVGGASASCRGANNALEFMRQRAKTLAALTTLDADILGLVELENDGYAATSAIADLVEGLNAAAGADRWAFIDADAATGVLNALGTDGIRVGLVYRRDRVTPVGQTAVLNAVAFVNGGDFFPRNRPALAQAFQRPDRGRVVVVVNHLKSKGSSCSLPDAGDGQGECNAVRTTAAAQLAEWLTTDPTDTGEEDVLIMGDLNAYAKEDPITTLAGAGYADLLAARVGPSAYSYVFDGQWGYLDHALASPTLAGQVSGVTEWHINADEPSVLDYNTDFKSPGLIASLYAPDPFRIADHDPVVVGLALAAPSVTYAFGGFLPPLAAVGQRPQAAAGSALPVRFSLGGDYGIAIFRAGFPASRPVSCTTGAPLGGYTPIRSPGNAGLTYSRGNRTYALTWKTDESWAGSCRELVLRFTDETQQRIVLDFRD